MKQAKEFIEEMKKEAKEEMQEEMSYIDMIIKLAVNEDPLRFLYSVEVALGDAIKTKNFGAIQAAANILYTIKEKINLLGETRDIIVDRYYDIGNKVLEAISDFLRLGDSHDN